MSDFKKIGGFVVEESANVSAHNTATFNFEIDVECEKSECGSVVASGDFSIDITQRTDNSVATKIKVWKVNDLEANKGWDQIENLGQALLKLAASGREKTKALLGDKYGKTLSEQYQERMAKSRE